MQITCNTISKKYNNHWVFKDFSHVFEIDKIYALLGSNGSGKSTLIRCLIGYENTTKGKVVWTDNNQKILESSQYFKHISFCAPSQEIIEEFTIKEFLQFHFTFKKLSFANSIEEIIDILELQKFLHVPIRDYSSGMKQRVKLAQAFFTDSSVLCLDEPTTNLDSNWISFYQDYIKKTSQNRLVLIASNQEIEYTAAQEIINIEQYKNPY